MASLAKHTESFYRAVMQHKFIYLHEIQRLSIKYKYQHYFTKPILTYLF
jgi:hypothetical protein